MIKDNVALLLHPSLRGRAFIQNMFKRDLIPSEIVLMDGKLENFSIPRDIKFKDYYNLYEEPSLTLEKNEFDFSKVYSLDCNNDKVFESLKNLKSDWIIYTGGGILQKRILSSGKKFIHVHPGRLPDYRGSTCFYYSIIKEGKCGFSAFVMDEKLDSGEIILQKECIPDREIDLDYVFDPWIRAETICDVLENFDFTKKIKLNYNDGQKSRMYYVIHPVLKHLAILKANKL